MTIFFAINHIFPNSPFWVSHDHYIQRFHIHFFHIQWEGGMGRKDAYTFPKSEAPGIWAEAPGTNPSGNPEPSIMKILSGEYIKASKVGYVRHESNVRDAQILNLTKKK